MHQGSCLCGAVSFDVEGELAGPDACHCRMCRKHVADKGDYYEISDGVPQFAGAPASPLAP